MGSVEISNNKTVAPKKKINTEENVKVVAASIPCPVSYQTYSRYCRPDKNSEKLETMCEHRLKGKKYLCEMFKFTFLLVMTFKMHCDIHIIETY